MNYLDPNLWFSAQGRINRRPYFFAGLLAGGLIEARKLVPEQFLILYFPLMLVAIYAGLVLGIKRCHDRDRTGWFMLLNVVPIISLWPIIELTFFKGTEGPNKYGADPLGGTAPAAVEAAPPAAPPAA